MNDNLTCPNCPGVITSTARQAAYAAEKGNYQPSQVEIKCTTCHAHLLVTIDWQPVPVAAVILQQETTNND